MGGRDKPAAAFFLDQAHSTFPFSVHNHVFILKIQLSTSTAPVSRSPVSTRLMMRIEARSQSDWEYCCRSPTEGQSAQRSYYCEI